MGACQLSEPEADSLLATAPAPAPVPSPVPDKPDSTLRLRLEVPDGYARIESGAFAAWLRELPLKEGRSEVKLHSGELKYNQNVHWAVVDLDVGERDLQQCADAVMRLRAEFLFDAGLHDDIAFNYTSGDRIPFSKWASGQKPVVSGNRVSWSSCSSCNSSKGSFRKYMDAIYMYAGTASLSKELDRKDLTDIEPGDVFIKGGFPGHAVIVVDVAENSNGNRVFAIAQSYMPAQSIHVLINPSDSELSPWYSVEQIENQLFTPEWTFDRDQLKSW